MWSTNVASNASDLFNLMQTAVEHWKCSRVSGDLTSPSCDQCMFEAKPGLSFELYRPTENVALVRELNYEWAKANVLHFFTGSEAAGELLKHNPQAERFLTGGRWVGAYGAIAMPQLRRCISLLAKSPESRRAIVSMGELQEQDINRPACISFMQLLKCDDRLDLVVFQRSLNLYGVMPYDCILLTNILLWAVHMLGVRAGSLHWCVGSLHTPKYCHDRVAGPKSLILRPGLLNDPDACYMALGSLEDVLV